MPIGDTGAAQFMAAHPTWDGRGVTVGILDLGVDLDHPGLQTTSTGERKIVDWVTYTDPLPTMATRPGSTWRPRSAARRSRHQGVDLHRAGRRLVPDRPVQRARPAPRRRGRQRRQPRRQPGRQQRHLRRALEHDARNKVYVDTNQNKSFADELAMTDYKVSYDVGYFGTDNPATAVARARCRSSCRPTARTSSSTSASSPAQHGSHVAGIVAAN